MQNEAAWEDVGRRFWGKQLVAVFLYGCGFAQGRRGGACVPARGRGVVGGGKGRCV